MTNTIYLDNAATTRLDDDILEKMMPWLSDNYGNPSSIYSFGRDAKTALEQSRERASLAINAKPNEIYFTGSGTEADNWAIKGAVSANPKKGRHIVISAIEHHAVLHTVEYLEKNGYEITKVPVAPNGIIDPAVLENSLREDTVLVSVMMANNEIGTIQPIAEISKILSGKDILFHTDAVQAVGSIPVDVKALGVDLLSLSAHKFHGPKGVGALYVKRGVRIDNLLHGGAQERTRRGSTENMAGIVGLGYAIEKAVANMKQNSEKIKKMRDDIVKRIMNEVPYTIYNGDAVDRLPGNANFSFRFIEGEGLLLFLDMNGIMASSGSACTSGSLDPSHVLLALGLDHGTAHGSLRLSFGTDNFNDDIDHVVETIKSTVSRLREMSPLYETFLKNGRKQEV